MNNKYQIYLISDSTGETLDRIFLALQSQFANFEYDKKEFVFIRTQQQIEKIIKECSEKNNSIILYTIVDTKLAKFLATQSSKNNIPCFGVLGNLILSFTGNGFAGFYVGGNHSYTILSRSSNEIYLRTVGFDTNGWFIKITNQE